MRATIETLQAAVSQRIGTFEVRAIAPHLQSTCCFDSLVDSTRLVSSR